MITLDKENRHEEAWEDNSKLACIHTDCMGGNVGFPPLFLFFSASPSTKVIKSKIAVGRHDLMKLFDWDLPLYWSPALCLQPAVFKFVQNRVVQTMLIFMRVWQMLRVESSNNQTCGTCAQIHRQIWNVAPHHMIFLIAFYKLSHFVKQKEIIHKI